MQPAPSPLLDLAQRLRQLRTTTWPDVRITQDALAKALGGIAPATVSSWESPTAPKLPPRDRMLAYARFFATRRSLEDESEFKLLPPDAFTEEEEATYQKLEAELLALRDAAGKPATGEAVAVRRSWRFLDKGPATLICAQLPKVETASLANPADPNYTELLSYADLDALVELHGHIRAENPNMDVFHKIVPKVITDDLSGHLILLGGIAWNEITNRLSAMISLPVSQIRDPSMDSGDPFITKVNGKEQRFLPKWSDPKQTDLVEDVGLFARTPNPLNSNRTLTICNGIHSRGVYAAVRCLTDARLRESNEQYISEHFGDSEAFVILMRVPVIEGKAMTPDFKNKTSILYQWSQNTGQ